jgi:hypothetical protein
MNAITFFCLEPPAIPLEIENQVQRVCVINKKHTLDKTHKGKRKVKSMAHLLSLSPTSTACMIKKVLEKRKKLDL